MKIAIIGGRGNGTVIASTIEDCSKAGQDIECVGFLNDNETEINGYKVLGGIQDNSWEGLDINIKFIYAMSNVKQAVERFQILKQLSIPVERFATVIHPSATVAKNSKLGHGVVIMPMAVIGSDVIIGNHSQMYAQSFVGHDTIIKEMVFIANNASVGGRVVIENGAHIGSNSSIIERVAVGAYSVVGLGSVVLKNVEANYIYAGNPARMIREINTNT